MGRGFLDGEAKAQRSEAPPGPPCESCDGSADGRSLDDVPLCGRCGKELAKEAARAFLAEPEVERRIKDAIQTHFNARLEKIAHHELLDDEGRRRLADSLEELAIERMKATMRMVAKAHVDEGRAGAESFLAFILPLLSAPEVPPCL